MVSKLRNKFVIVTTLLLLTLFGGFLIVNTLYTNYWNEKEIVEMLDWIAYSGIFTSNPENVTNREENLIMDMTKDESPIAGIILNQEGNVVASRVLGENVNIDIPDSIIKRMLEHKGGKKRIGKYYYSYLELNDGTVLLVVMKSISDRVSGMKIMGICILVSGGIVLLETIIILLSKFVTGPAEQTLLREKQFISDASHELKTPLGAISINAQALRLENADNLYINNIISESQRMSRLVEKLLLLSKYDEQETISVTKISLSEICEEMVLTYEYNAFEKQLVYDYSIIPDVCIKGNEDEIRQLLAILIDNAIKNTDAGGSIYIRCQENKRHGEIAITNIGAAIPEDVLPHVFERFYTSDKSRTNGSFGLGLSIAKSIVDLHRGTITVESTENEEVTFRVVI